MPRPQTTLPVLKLTVAAGLCTALLMLSACGSDTTTSSSTAASPSGSAAASPSASASGTASPSVATATVKPSTNLDGITVTGAYGTTPTVKIATTPWAIDKTRAKVLSAGTGGTITDGMTVEVNYFGVDARTGKTFDESFSKGKSIAFPLDQVIPGFKKGLVGQRQGSRVVIAMPGPDAYDASGGQAQAGINVGDTLIFVVDVVAIPLTEPAGTKVTPKSGLPTVSASLTDPKITVPKTDPPATVVVQPLIKGAGKKVAATDAITFHYRWVKWADGKTVETDYGQKASQASIATLISGLQKGLVGQTVGSRVLVVVPAKTDYPNGQDSPKIEPTDTLVFVVDILFTSSAAS
ncbi:MAG: FKBP-type peptidyl-prolyl cis-trans isomerase [Propionibacteriaceae bacterium]